MEKEYAQLIIKDMLKKKESLFICTSKKNEKFAFMLLKLAKENNINDIHLNYYDEGSSYTKWKEYIFKDASFIFVFENGYEDTLATRIYNGFMAEEINVDFLAVPTYSCLVNNQIQVLIPTSKKDLSMLLSAYKKIIANIKNYKFDRISLSSLMDLDLKLDFANEIKGIVYNGNIPVFPNYALEFKAVEEASTGFVTATDVVRVNGLEINDFRATIKAGVITDFDCSSHIKEAKDIFNKRNMYRVNAFTLVDNTSSLYNNFYNNIVLDRSTKSSIIIKSNDNKEIMIPIQTRTLNVDAYKINGKSINLYENESIGSKILMKK